MMIDIKALNDFKQFENSLVVFEEKGAVSFGFMYSEDASIIDGNSKEKTSFRIYKFCKKHFIFSPDAWNYGIIEGPLFGTNEGRIWKSMHSYCGIPRTIIIDGPLFMRKALPFEGDSLTNEAISGEIIFFDKSVDAKIKETYDTKLKALTKQHFVNLMFIFGRHNNDSIISTLPQELVFEIIDLSDQ